MTKALPIAFVAVSMLAGTVLARTASPPPHGSATAPDEAEEETDLDELCAALEEAGFATEVGDEVEQPFFAVTGRFLRLDGDDVQVFEYPDAAARRADSETISADGRTIGGAKPMWIGTPRFWAGGRIIVLYLGDDEQVIEALSGVLGGPIAGPG